MKGDNLLFVRRIAWLVTGAFIACSCGGGGGGVGTQINPVATYRANQPGDEWDYAVAINFGKFGAYKGTLTITLANDTYNGSPSIKQTQVFNLQLKTGPSKITSYEEYSPKGVLLAETIDAKLQVVSSNTLSVLSPLAIGNISSGTLTFQSGLTIDETYKITSAAAIATTIGNYNCWVIDQTAKRSDGVSDTVRMWVAPETGNYVVLKDATDNGDGTGYTYTAKLTTLIAPISGNHEPIPNLDRMISAIRAHGFTAGK